MLLCASPHMCDNEIELAMLLRLLQVINILHIYKPTSLQLENSTNIAWSLHLA
jgi:hypothetical protein